MVGTITGENLIFGTRGVQIVATRGGEGTEVIRE